MAKIQKLITGADGQTRGAILQLANKAEHPLKTYTTTLPTRRIPIRNARKD